MAPWRGTLIEKEVSHMTRDPVCGMILDPATSMYETSYHGHQYHFCSKNCKNKFDGHPAGYLKHKGIFARFLDWIAKGNKKTYHGHPPNCCDH